MATIEVRTFIRATPERVWEIIADLAAMQDWMVDVRSLEISSEAKSGLGTVIETTSELFGLPLLRSVMEVTTWDPPREMSVVHRGQFSGRGVLRLEPVRGGTVFSWWDEFRPPLGALGELGHALFVRPHLQRVFGRSMDNVRLLAESAGSAEG